MVKAGSRACRYGFSCPSTLEEFLQRPAEYIAAARGVLKAQPHLIPIFGTTDTSLPRFVSEVADISYGDIKCNYGTQTPTHFVERYIDQTCAPLSLDLAAMLVIAHRLRAVTKRERARTAGMNGTSGSCGGGQSGWQICVPRSPRARRQ